jgi:hypothetical protein
MAFASRRQFIAALVYMAYVEVIYGIRTCSQKTTVCRRPLQCHKGAFVERLPAGCSD